MKTNEIFEHVLQIVCEECELCYGELINGANKNAVDARCLLICALVSLGFSEENTAAYLSMTRQIKSCLPLWLKFLLFSHFEHRIFLAAYHIHISQIMT